MAAVWVVAGPHSALARVGLLLLVMTGVVLPHSAFARVGAVAVVTAVGRPRGAFPVAEGRVLSAGCCGPVRAWPISGAGGSGLASVRGSGQVSAPVPSRWPVSHPLAQFRSGRPGQLAVVLG